MKDNFEINTFDDLEHWNKSSTYNLRHLAEHLYEAGYYEKLYRLLIGNRAWMQAKFYRFGSDREFANDLELASSKFVDPLTQQEIGILTQLQAAIHIIYQRASYYNQGVLEALVWIDRTSEALEHARLRTNNKEKFDALFTIYTALREKGEQSSFLLNELSETAESIVITKDSSQVLSELVWALSLDGHFSEARSMIAKIQTNWYKEYAWHMLARSLVYYHRFDEAKEIMYHISVGRQTDVRVFMVQELARLEQFDDAKRLIDRKILNVRRRADSLRHLAVELAKRGHEAQANEYFAEAWKTIVTIRKKETRANELMHLASSLHQTGRERKAKTVFSQAMGATRAIDDVGNRSARLRALGRKLIQAGYEKEGDIIFDESLEATLQVEDFERRLKILIALAETLYQIDRQIRADEVLVEIVDTVDYVKDVRKKDVVLRNLSTSLARNMRFEIAVEVADSIHESDLKADALYRVSIALAKSSVKEQALLMYDRADRINIERIFVSNQRSISRALRQVAIALAKLECSLGAIESILKASDIETKVYTLCDVGLVFAQTANAEKARITFKLARELINSVLDCEIDDNLSRYLSSRLAKAGHYPEAREVSRSIRSNWKRCRALIDLEVVVGDNRLEPRLCEVIEVAKSIESVQKRVQTLKYITTSLARAGYYDQALVPVREIQNLDQQSLALGGLVPLLVKDNHPLSMRIIDELMVASNKIEDDKIKIQILINVTTVSARDKRLSSNKTLIRNILTVIRNLEATQLPPAILRDLSIAFFALGERQKAMEFLENAAASAKIISNSGERGRMLCDLVVLQSQEKCTDDVDVLLGLALDAARSSESSKRVYTLLSVANACRKIGRHSDADAISDEALEFALSIPVHQGQHRALQPFIREQIGAQLFGAAFSTIRGLDDIDRFLQYVAEWSFDSETQARKVLIGDLVNAIRIVGWVRPDWDSIYDSLSGVLS